ncbi:mannose-6-phosphate isomerase 1 [Aegilops tauschii subsp. strangulata]|uniref:Mannose-6-phosphate isomerase n=6 Tax=Triticinae TaxID=1648030 RepID=A0A453HXT4_AEGTS|nr:mannose-6-phosphate isomerase 1 [Aegilops tauschii subsp. strangulata]XP_044374760.1 mannose-6-phosphate isomerase 1-like [Triticum aestivum]
MASSSTASSSAQLGLGLGLGLGAMGGLGLLLPADREHDPELEPCSPPKGVLRLRGAVQHYEWGSRGDASLVARLAGETEEGRPCAELWMGTHPAAPSSLASDDGGAVSLREWLARNPAALLGRVVTARWDGDLPFLFKVLSVAKPLSIQAHPDRELARALHALRPTTYRDANHKPEMAVAVTEFRALCGFVSVQELKDVLRTVPEVRMLVGKEDVVKLMTAKEHDGGIGVRSYLQSAFTKLMATSKEAVAEAISKLRSRLNGEIKIRTFTEKEQLVLSLEQQYPGDVGVLSAFFFNYVKLRPGEALYIGANEPHAYLSGECVECMATSDNVIRAGLTPKYKDVQTLCSMLTYKQMFPEILQGVLVQPYVIRYTPPFDEFEVDRYLLPQGESVTMLPVPGPSIFLVMTGEGEIQADGMPDEGVAKEGDVFFVPARTEVKLHASGPGCLQLYRAGVNSRFFC